MARDRSGQFTDPYEYGDSDGCLQPIVNFVLVAGAYAFGKWVLSESLFLVCCVLVVVGILVPPFIKGWRGG